MVPRKLVNLTMPTSERERVEYLFALYERMQAPLAAAAAKPRTRRRRVT